MHQVELPKVLGAKKEKIFPSFKVEGNLGGDFYYEAFLNFDSLPIESFILSAICGFQNGYWEDELNKTFSGCFFKPVTLDLMISEFENTLQLFIQMSTPYLGKNLEIVDVHLLCNEWNRKVFYFSISVPSENSIKNSISKLEVLFCYMTSE